MEADRPSRLSAPVVASLPAGRKALPARWWAADFEPGTTLLARDLARCRRARRGLANQDARMQQDDRAFARWAWSCGLEEMFGEAGHA